MERFKTDAQTGLRYELQGDYYVIAGEDEAELLPIGIWGQWHLRWLKRNRRVTHTNLLTTGRLYEYLQGIDTQANEQLALLIRQMAKAEGDHRATESGRSNGMGQTDEQYTEQSGRDHKQRVDLLLSGNGAQPIGCASVFLCCSIYRIKNSFHRNNIHCLIIHRKVLYNSSS